MPPNVVSSASHLFAASFFTPSDFEAVCRADHIVCEAQLSFEVDSLGNCLCLCIHYPSHYSIIPVFDHSYNIQLSSLIK